MSDQMWDDEDRAVLAHLPFDEVAPPPDLEDRVMAAALTRRPETKARGGRRGQAILAGLAIAALIAAVVMIAVNRRTALAPTRIQGASATHADVDAALSERGVRTGELSNGGGRVALARDGRGFLYDLTSKGELAVAVDNVTLGKTRPHAGIIEITVRHPELVRAITVTDASGQVYRATLQP